MTMEKLKYLAKKHPGAAVVAGVGVICVLGLLIGLLKTVV